MKYTVKNVVITLYSIFFISLHICNATATPLGKVESMELPKQTQQQQSDSVKIIRYENVNIGTDGYEFAFETSDGVSRKESATVKNIGTEEEAISVEGTVSWLGPDGVHYTLNYLADENGFQPEGDHLPLPPEV